LHRYLRFKSTCRGFSLKTRTRFVSTYRKGFPRWWPGIGRGSHAHPLPGELSPRSYSRDWPAVDPNAQPTFKTPADTTAQEHVRTHAGVHADPLASETATVAIPGSDSMPVMVAQQAARSFSIVHLHGYGGHGIVCLATDDVLHRSVAIKQIRVDQRRNPRIRARFLKEAEITGQLEHPGIIPIYGLECDATGDPFLVMRFIQGRTVKEAIADYHAQPTPAALSELLRRFESVCQTLAYAHSRGVIHRDLKPANIMIGDYGETLVVDWGLALCRVASPQPHASGAEAPPGEAQPPAEDAAPTGHVLGTPGYMAPELARGTEGDERADVFGLGALLCCILTGKPAVVGSGSVQIIEKTRAGDLAETRTRLQACGADADLVQLALACLAPDAGARPCHAGAVAERVAAYRSSVQERLQAAEMERAAAQATARHERKQRRLVAALAAALVLLVATAALVLFWYEKDQVERRREVELLLGTGQHLVQKGHFADAEAAWQRGLQVAQHLWHADDLRSALDARVRLAERGQKAQNVHELTELLHFYALQEFLPRRGWHVLNAGARHLWQERAFLAQADVRWRLEQKMEQQVHDDLLALAILWGDLQVRMADPKHRPQARREALVLLGEAAKLCGANVVLEEDRRRHASILGEGAIAAAADDRLTPQTAWDHQGLGRCALMRGDLDAAARHFQRALELQPLSFLAQFLGGVTAARQGRHAEALAAFSVCIGQQPKAECYHHRGLASLALGRREAALRDFDQALARQPGHGPSYLQRGLLRAQDQQWEAAAVELNKALEAEADPIAAHYHLACVCAGRKDLAGARTHLQKLLELQPEHQEGLNLQTQVGTPPTDGR
jgi:serine/threonine protein kinase